MKTSDVLYRAAYLIEQRGWTAGQWGNLDGSSPLCLEGAILAALELHAFEAIDFCPAGQAVRDYLGLTNGDGSRLYNWNDQTGAFCRPDGKQTRTADEVTALLRAVAAEQAVAEEADAIVASAASLPVVEFVR